MKRSNFYDVQCLMDDRNELIKKLDYAMGGNYANSGLGITIRGQYQDDDMINACRPAVTKELKRRIQLIDEQLTALGVDTEN